MSETHPFPTSMNISELAHFAKLLEEKGSEGYVPVFYRKKESGDIVYKWQPRTECVKIGAKWVHKTIPIDPPTPEQLGGEYILTPSDMQDFNTATKRIYALMRTGGWYTREQIIQASGQAEGTRRMRELRRYFEVLTRRAHGRTFEYKLQRKAA